MKAMVRDAYGPPAVLQLRYIDIPEIGDDEVLLRVHAAGVGRDVWHVMTGLPYPIRLAGYGLRTPKNPGIGSYAEYARAPEDKLAPKPANLTFEQAAVLAIMGSTALQALRDQGKVEPGQEVLIIGASGGVGTYAVQIAKAFGAQVTGVCSTAKVEMVRSIGADHVIDYKREDFAEGNQRYDLIVDIGGNSSLARLRRALAPRGTLVIVGGEGGGRWLGGLERQLWATMLSPFVSQKLGTFVSTPNYEDLLVLKDLIESGKVTQVIDRTYPLAEVPEAMRYLEGGHAKGKVLITV